MKRKYYNFDEIFVSSLVQVALEIVKMTTFSAASDENFIKMTTFPFQRSADFEHVTHQCVWKTVITLESKRPHGPLARYVKLRFAHASEMPEIFAPPRVNDPDIHHSMCVVHVPWCMPGSLTSGFIWSRWWGKRSRHSQHMRNLQFYVSGKRPTQYIEQNILKQAGIYSVSKYQCQISWEDFCRDICKD